MPTIKVLYSTASVYVIIVRSYTFDPDVLAKDDCDGSFDDLSGQVSSAVAIQTHLHIGLLLPGRVSSLDSAASCIGSVEFSTQEKLP